MGSISRDVHTKEMERSVLPEGLHEYDIHSPIRPPAEVVRWPHFRGEFVYHSCTIVDIQ